MAGKRRVWQTIVGEGEPEQGKSVYDILVPPTPDAVMDELVLDAKPLVKFADAVAEAAGLPTLAEKTKASEHFESIYPEHGLSIVVELDHLVESETNPRKHFTGIEELAESIKKVGLLVPLLVRTLPDGRYEIVAGHRRYRAAKLAGLSELPCEVRELTDVQTLEVQLTENIQRDDLTPLEEADGYDALMKASGYTADQVAAKAGKSRGWVYARLKLRSLGPEGRTALEAGTLSATLAVALARVPSHKDQAVALERVATWSVRDALAYLQQDFCLSLKGAPFDRKDEFLYPEAGACTACPKRSGSTPGLFEDLTGSDWCTDTTCFAVKTRATWEEKAAKFERQGAAVLDIDQGKKLFKWSNQLQYGSKYVEAGATAEGDPGKRTWGELLELVPKDDQPKKFVVPDTEMKARQLYVERDVLHALSTVGLKWARQKAEAKAEKSSSPGAADELATGRQAARLVREEVVRDLAMAAAAKAKKDGFTPSWARVLARGVMTDIDLPDVYRAALKIGSEEALDTWVGEASKEQVLALMVCLLLPGLINTWEEFDADAIALAKSLGFDLKALVKAKLETPKPDKK
jgi:ParB/RepB/Spo0J family partition protein